MAGPASGTVAAAGGFLAIMTLTPFGIPFQTLMLGGACFFGGCACRTGVALYRKLDGNDPLLVPFFIRQIAMLLCCIPLSGGASFLTFLGAHVANIEADAGCGGLLFVMGLRGIEGFQWLTDTLSAVFTKFAPGQKPSGGG